GLLKSFVDSATKVQMSIASELGKELQIAAIIHADKDKCKKIGGSLSRMQREHIPYRSLAEADKKRRT
ncbi:hypothetical protein PMAYCL1PPCAC_22862, partial [Pristionchus mayeri]